MKKFIALLMVVILGISLCACGNSSNNSDKYCQFASCNNTDLNSKGYCSIHTCPECGDAWDTLLQCESHYRYGKMCSKCLVTEYEDDIKNDARFCFNVSQKSVDSSDGKLYIFFDNTTPFEFENATLTFTVASTTGDGDFSQTLKLGDVSAFQENIIGDSLRSAHYVGLSKNPKYYRVENLTVTFDSITFNPYY